MADRRRTKRNKITAALMLLSMLTLGVSPVSTYAEDTPSVEYEEYTENDTADMDINVHIDSEFSVRIPKGIVGYDKESVEYTLGVKGNIELNTSVYVEPDKILTLSSDGAEYDCDVTQEKQEWLHNEILRDSWNNGTGKIEFKETLGAGDYTGVLNFNIYLGGPSFNITVVDELGNDLNAKAKHIVGNTKNSLLAELVSSGNIDNANEIDLIINIDTDTFDGEATATINISTLANENDTVIFYHYDETTNEWEYIGMGTVDDIGNVSNSFTSFSPVCIKVVPSVEGHTHDITKEIIKEPDCTTEGSTKVSCTCGIAYIEKLDYKHDLSGGECNNCNYIIAGIYSRFNSSYSCITTWDNLGLNSDCSNVGSIVSNYKNASKIILPDSVTSIANYAFEDCTGIEYIIVPSSVEKIGDCAFQDCTNIYIILI